VSPRSTEARSWEITTKLTKSTKVIRDFRFQLVELFKEELERLAVPAGHTGKARRRVQSIIKNVKFRLFVVFVSFVVVNYFFERQEEG
jgi:hypothetical protein